MTVKKGAHLWDRHPHVRTGSDLTTGEKAADSMRNGFGSWTFVICFSVFLAIWMIINSGLILGTHSWDKYPWILLNLMLSCLAALQGALILIAAKRADRVAAEAAVNHYSQTSTIDQLQSEQMTILAKVRANTDLLEEIHAHVAALSPEAGNFPPRPSGSPQ